LGATINIDGNAIYYALAAVFFAQMFGIDLGLVQYLAILFTATVGSIGQAGVPGPSLLVVAVLVAADLPILGLPLLYAVDRIFDMIRTALNITGDATCAIIIDGIKSDAETEKK
jgi:Na+/H+-dicarboxylate symporter